MTHDAVGRDRAKVERLVAHGELVAIHPREIEQVLHEPVEAPALPGDRRRGRVGVDGAVREPFRVPEDGGERRLQLVADREQERALGVARVLELSRHVVEGLGERHELRRALGRNRARVDTCREAAARVGDAPNGPGDPPREQKRDRRRERHADRRREQQPFEVRAPCRGADHARSQQLARVVGAAGMPRVLEGLLLAAAISLALAAAISFSSRVGSPGPFGASLTRAAASRQGRSGAIPAEGAADCALAESFNDMATQLEHARDASAPSCSRSATS